MLSDYQNKKFSHVFKMLDRNGDQHIDKRDLEGIVAALAEVRGLAASSPRVSELLGRYRAMHDAMVSHADTNEDGKVTLREFLDHQQILLDHEDQYRDEVNKIAELFCEILDHDSDGMNDLEDYTMFLRAMRLDESQAKTNFARLDKNGDGQLSQSELKELLQEFYFDKSPGAPGNVFFGSV